MGWSPYDYNTSSPQEFYFACKGYFDKEDNRMLVQRKVGQIVWGGAGGEPTKFNQFWPITVDIPEVKTWGTKEDAEALRKQIEKAHGIKLS